MRELLAQREAHIVNATAGVDAARTLSDLTDRVVRELARAASSPVRGRWALVALGGWGAGALLPRSDLDVLVLAEADEHELRPFVEQVLYPLWDAGLAVGHQVRSPKQQLRAMREDVKTATAALTARPIAGDEVWAVHAIEGWMHQLHRRAARQLAAVIDRPRPGSPYALEPDLKEDRGGRRDFDELVWSAAILSGTRVAEPSALVGLGVLDAAELAGVAAAADVVAEARWELQRAGFDNRMAIESEVLLGERAERVQAGLGVTALVLERVRAAVQAPKRRSGVWAASGAGSPNGFGLQSGERAEPCKPLTADALFALMDAGPNAARALEEAVQSGAAEVLLPGLRGLMSCRRPGLGHQLTVGAHQLKAACLLASPPSSDGALLRSLESLTPRQLRCAQLAALVHDNGKRDGGAGHAERGTEPARQAACRFGMTDEEASDVADLVRLHLLLAETALRDDLDDEDAVLRCAARLGRAELLAPLHLLTAADAQATGPATWTAWTSALVATLVARLDAAVAHDENGAGLLKRAEAVRAATLSEMPTTAIGTEREFVQRAPLRYLAGRDVPDVLADARLVADFAREPSAAAQISVSPGPAAGTHAVTVVAMNRPAVLARLAGALALAGLQILAVDAFEGPSAIVLDRFVVEPSTGRPATPETFTRLERLVRAALSDRLGLQARLAERRRHYPPCGKGDARVSVTPTGWSTVLRVTAPDRPGLLHDIARAVADSGLSVAWAKVVTVDGMARDVFHLVEEDGGPAKDAGALGHVTMRVRAVL